MEPFFFGESEKRLYGVFHEADPARQRGRAVLMLYPVGQEYMRIHRAYRRLADSLAQSGFDVLRFDYACTGDSWGQFESASIADFVTSAVTAYDELKALSPASGIDVVSLRLGTAVARQLVSKRTLRSLVLWEPKENDVDFLTELHNDILRKGTNRANFLDADGTLHYNGYHYNTDLQAELQHSGWTSFQCSQASAVYLISTAPVSSFSGFRENLNDDEGLLIEQIDGPDDWTFVDSVGGLFLPEPSLAAITRWICA